MLHSTICRYAYTHKHRKYIQFNIVLFACMQRMRSTETPISHFATPPKKPGNSQKQQPCSIRPDRQPAAWCAPLFWCASRKCRQQHAT